MKAVLRKIVVEEQTYIWRTEHKYIPLEKSAGQYNVISTFAAFREGYKRSPLRIFFKTIDAYPSGSPLKMGTMAELHGESVELNLNFPSFAVKLISQGIKNGWNHEAKKPFIIDDGLQLLESMGYETSSLKI